MLRFPNVNMLESSLILIYFVWKKYLVTWGNLNFSKRTEKCMYYSNTQYNRRYIKTLSLMLFITTEIIKCDKKYKII